jgi:hypothetical protein
MHLRIIFYQFFGLDNAIVSIGIKVCKQMDNC